MISTDKNFIFIDFDGTLVKTVSGYSFQTGIIDCQPIWSVWNSLKTWSQEKKAKNKEAYVMIVSNQGGIETKRGSSEFYLKAKFEYIKMALQEYLDKDMNNVKVNYIYCPSNDPKNPNRKPNPGMFSRSLVRFGIDPTNINKNECVMIGDASGIDNGTRKDFSNSDLMAARNYGIDYIDVADV